MNLVSYPRQTIRQSHVEQHAPSNGRTVLNQDPLELGNELGVVALAHIHTGYQGDLRRGPWAHELQVNVLMWIRLERLTRKPIDLKASRGAIAERPGNPGKDGSLAVRRNPDNVVSGDVHGVH